MPSQAAHGFNPADFLAWRVWRGRENRVREDKITLRRDKIRVRRRGEGGQEMGNGGWWGPLPPPHPGPLPVRASRGEGDGGRPSRRHQHSQRLIAAKTARRRKSGARKVVRNASPFLCLHSLAKKSGFPAALSLKFPCPKFPFQKTLSGAPEAGRGKILCYAPPA